MSKNCFNTIPYRGGFIHICYNSVTHNEEIKVSYNSHAFPDLCNTLIGAKRKLTRISKNPLFN